MGRVSTLRSDRLEEHVTAFVKRLVEEPVKEAVREALAEEGRPPHASHADDSEAGSDESGEETEPGDGGRSRIGVVVPLVGLVVLSYAVRRWWGSSRTDGVGADESDPLDDERGRSTASDTDGNGAVDGDVNVDDELQDGDVDLDGIDGSANDGHRAESTDG